MTRPRFHLSRRRRQRIEALVAHLVDLLDAVDGDPDMEPETDEDDGEEASLQPVPRRVRCFRRIRHVTLADYAR
ncbi:hypothetical protein GXW78_16035 [Roseomonas terrae]|jgi:hypothetical protein|uniref:Uncharacterized protein n=1 Tax=Neoroseomonas terrae TaxID=424799 RepID=A0ABS5EJH7_9PROT|nr:hypothetical protein [Neoroseomonas terrae]MBR0651183.1 hypothetical protein [Neoroseomonas terrae]